MPASDYAEYLEFACRVAAAAGAAILPHFRQSIAVFDKGAQRAFDPVTEADRGAESVIRDEIARKYPTHGIFGEEHGRTRGASPLTWVIDPIDGTRSFILGQLHWGTLIALHDGREPIVGVMHQPFVGETFAASRDSIAQWRRGHERRTLATRPCENIDDAIVATTDPRHFHTPARASAYRAVTEGTRLVRYGGDCYCYTLLAMGQVDIVIETGLQPYDVQALIPIVEAAGGRMTDWQGGPCDNGGDVLACGDRALHAQLLARIAAA
jgi:histidinol-phosphatase